jgi:hypothetical protein
MVVGVSMDLLCDALEHLLQRVRVDAKLDGKRADKIRV